VKSQEEKAQLQREKEKLLIERAMVKEAVRKSCHSILGLAQGREGLGQSSNSKPRRDPPTTLG
jgi:hypothetical protein